MNSSTNSVEILNKVINSHKILKQYGYMWNIYSSYNNSITQNGLAVKFMLKELSSVIELFKAASFETTTFLNDVQLQACTLMIIYLKNITLQMVDLCFTLKKKSSTNSNGSNGSTSGSTITKIENMRNKFSFYKGYNAASSFLTRITKDPTQPLID